MTSGPAPLGRTALMLLAALLAAAPLAPLPAQAVEVPFEPSRWTIDAPRADFVEYLGRPSLRLASGSALLKGAELRDGVIEVDVSAPSGGFAFVFFRAASAADREDVYLRMSSSGSADAVQYQPTYGLTGAWQLYHGPGYTAPAPGDHDRTLGHRRAPADAALTHDPSIEDDTRISYLPVRWVPISAGEYTEGPGSCRTPGVGYKIGCDEERRVSPFDGPSSTTTPARSGRAP